MSYKFKRRNVGSVIKSSDPDKSNYIKVNEDINLRKGQFLSVESKKFQLSSLEKAIKAGKLSEEAGLKARARIEKIPDFVLGDIILVEKSEA